MRTRRCRGSARVLEDIRERACRAREPETTPVCRHFRRGRERVFGPRYRQMDQTDKLVLFYVTKIGELAEEKSPRG